MLLGIETSGQGFSLALAEPDGRTVRGVFLGCPLKARPVASRLLPALDFLLRDAGADKRSISRIGASAGPGGFTGLRSGLCVAKALARELGVPLVLVPTLLARSRWHLDGQAPEGRPVVVAVDARRKQLYGAAYLFAEGRWRTLLEPCCASASDFLASAAQALAREGLPAPVFCREPELFGGLAIPADWEPCRRVGPLAPTALEIAALAAQEGDCLAPADPASAEPLYVRAPDAKLPKVPQPPMPNA